MFIYYELNTQTSKFLKILPNIKRHFKVAKKFKRVGTYNRNN